MEEEEYSELDKAIALYIEVKTPREIAVIVGTTPDRVIARAEEMKDEVDALSIEAQIYFLVRRLNKIAADAQDKAEKTAGAKDAAGLYSAAVQAISNSLKQLNLLKKENESAIAELNQKRIREILRLFDAVVWSGVKDISKKHGLNEDELLDVFQGKIKDSAAAVDGGTAPQV